MGVTYLELQGHFGHFDLQFQEIWLVRAIACIGFELESPNLHQVGILVLKMDVIDPDFQGHFAISTQETPFNVALYYWSRPAKGWYTSQTCSRIETDPCIWYKSRLTYGFITEHNIHDYLRSAGGAIWYITDVN